MKILRLRGQPISTLGTRMGKQKSKFGVLGTPSEFDGSTNGYLVTKF